MVTFVEPQYFSIPAYRWRVGMHARTLRYPFTTVLTRQLARNYCRYLTLRAALAPPGVDC
jgi:hypothetical protein